MVGLKDDKKTIILKNNYKTIGLSSILACLFLLSIVIVHVNDSIIVVFARYAIALMCVGFGMINNSRLSIKTMFLVIFTLLTGLLNYYIVGNMSALGLVYCTVSPFIAAVFLDDKVEPESILVPFYVSIAIILVGFATKGISAQVFRGISNNYISVYLIFILSLYYSIAEKRNRKINLIHMSVCWLVCLLAQGRGGILVTTFMLVMLYWVKYRNSEQSNVSRIIGYGIAVLCIGIVGVILLNQSMLINMSFMERFKSHGMDGNGRLLIWGTYIRCSLSSIQSFIFGTKTSDIPLIAYFEGDMHNSFLALHAFNGIIYLCYILVLCVITGVNAIKYKRWVFLICFISICLRGITDKTFWGSAAGTPVFLYFLLNDFRTKEE